MKNKNIQIIISTIACLVFLSPLWASCTSFTSNEPEEIISIQQEETVPETQEEKAGIPEKTSNDKPPDQRGNAYNIEQAISDRAQLNTIAFSALAFLTGDLCSNTFLPPGKIADFFGFQYLRDNTADGMGHNTDFVTRNSNNVLAILNDGQKGQLIDLAKNQVEKINDYAYKRFVLIKAFQRLLEGDLPSGSTGLDKKAVIDYSAQIYLIDGQISLERADVLGDIIRSFTQSQRDALNEMAEGGFQSWAEIGDQIDKRSISHDEHVAVMTYAGQLFSWYTVSLEADTYFCPERHGTYFGSFYLKDIPAMGNPDYTIDESITGNKGETFLTFLNQSQEDLISSLIDIQREDLNGIMETREDISIELRSLMVQESVEEETMFNLAEKYGALDGEIVYYYVNNFAELSNTLSSEQKTQLMDLRDLDDYPCQGAYLYSENIQMPEIVDTDFLFGPSMD